MEEEVFWLPGIVAGLRSVIVEIEPKQYQSGQIAADKEPLDARFFWLPEEQLAA